MRRSVGSVAGRARIALPAGLLAAVLLAAGMAGAGGPAAAAGAVPAAAAPAGGRPLGLDGLFGRYRIDRRSVGYAALDAATGALLTGRHPDGLFVPASAIKAATAIMALEVLGADHRAATRLFRTGPDGAAAADGVLNGDLILVGGGDPELYTEHFMPMIRALKALGVRRLGGRFLYDDSLFPESPAISAAHGDDVAYNAGIGALSLNFNRLRLSWTRSRQGLKVGIASKTDRMTVPVDIAAAGIAPAGTRARHGVVRVDDGPTARWLVVPPVRRSGALWVPVRRVGLTAAHVFRRLARDAGIALPAPRRGPLPPGAIAVAAHRAEPLIEAVRHFLKYSNNAATEIVGRAATRRIAGAPLPPAQSGAAMANWFVQRLPAADWTGLAIANHSGLTRQTRISPRQMAAILRWAAGRDYGGRRLRDLMQPYWSGAVAAARRQRRAAGGPGIADTAGPKRASRLQVQGKTGTLNHVRSLAGYMTARSGREIVFAVFIDDGRARRAAAAAGRRYRPFGPARWAWRSRAVLNGIVRRIALDY